MMCGMCANAALAVLLLPAAAAVAPPPPSSLRGPLGSNRSASGVAAAAGVSGGGRQLTTANVQRSFLDEGQGCNQISRRACCAYVDNRADRPEFFKQPCVPARDGSFFNDGSECQAACWTEGTCGSGSFQDGIALQCKDKYVLLRPGQTCDAEGFLPISGDRLESPAECLRPARELVGLRSDLSESFETDESTSGGCYYSSESNSLTFNFGSPSPQGSPSRQYLCIRRKEERDLIPDGGGCFQLPRGECCGYSDNRVDLPEYFDQPCVPARSYSTFSDGTECQPACWVEGNCGSGSPQLAVSQPCMDKYVLLRPGETCDSDLPISGGDRLDSRSECFVTARKFVGLRSHLSESYETDESFSGGCYYSPESNSLTFNFGSPSPKGSPSRQYLCIRRQEERAPVPNGGGCDQSSRSLCCLYSDNRANLTEFFNQPCVPAAGLSTFSDGTECQPACLTEGTCGSEVSQGNLSQQCAHKYVLLSPGETCDTAGLLSIGGNGDEREECFFVAPKFVAQWSNASLNFDTEESLSGGCYYSSGSNTLTFSHASPSSIGSPSRRYLCIRSL